jgi:hypothetical protein
MPGETHDVRGHFPYHEYEHPTDHTHERPHSKSLMRRENIMAGRDMDEGVEEAFAPAQPVNKPTPADLEAARGSDFYKGFEAGRRTAERRTNQVLDELREKVAGLPREAYGPDKALANFGNFARGKAIDQCLALIDSIRDAEDGR